MSRLFMLSESWPGVRLSSTPPFWENEGEADLRAEPAETGAFEV